MNTRFKYAVILTAMMGSAAAIAATGDPVDGSNFTITVRGTVLSGTCTAAIDSNNQSFDVSSTQVSTATQGTRLASLNTAIMLTSCNGVPMSAKVQAGTAFGASNMVGSFTEEGSSVLGYAVGFSAATGLEGGTGDNHYVPVDNSAATTPLTITPDSDNYRLQMSTDVYKVGAGALAGGVSTLSGTYTYSLTYL